MRDTMEAESEILAQGTASEACVTPEPQYKYRGWYFTSSSDEANAMSLRQCRKLWRSRLQRKPARCLMSQHLLNVRSIYRGDGAVHVGLASDLLGQNSYIVPSYARGLRTTRHLTKGQMKQRVTITSKNPLPIGAKVDLVKQPDNEYDGEAIAVVVNGVQDGYVSAFYKTRKPETVSAGRIFDRFADSIEGVVVAEGVVEVELRTTITTLD